MKTKEKRLIFNFIVKLICALGIIGIGIMLLTKTTFINEATLATLITFIVGALGVSLGYTVRNDTNKEPIGDK